MDVKDIAGEGFAPGWPAEQEGNLAIGLGVLREVVVNNEHIATCFHKMLGDAGCGVGRDIGQTRRVVTFGYNNHRIIHRALFAEVGDGLRHRGSALADGTINTDHIFPSLVQDGVDGDGRLARLAVT